MEGDECENDGLNRGATNAKSYQEAQPTIKEYETIIQRHKRDMLSVACRQGCVFKEFKESNEFLDTRKKSRISISTINFKANLTNILVEFPKLKKSSLSLHFFKNYFKTIKETCKESGEEFK